MSTRSLAVVLALLAPALAGCGGGSDEAAEEAKPSASADPAVQECREQWQELGDEAQEQAGDPEEATPSTLGTRWVTVTAQIDYYASAAGAADCEETLQQEQDRIEQLADFTDDLAPFDLERALARYDADLGGTAYARPSGRKGRGAPTAKQVSAALEDLTRLAPQVTAAQAAGWQQAAVVDLGNAKARKKAVADLRVVSEESAVYRKAQRAKQVLERAADAVG